MSLVGNKRLLSDQLSTHIEIVWAFLLITVQTQSVYYCVVPYGGLFLRWKFFTNWPIPMFCKKSFTNHQDQLVV